VLQIAWAHDHNRVAYKLSITLIRAHISWRFISWLIRLPKGPRGLLFKEFLPAMNPLLNELRAIATARRKEVSQVIFTYTTHYFFLWIESLRSFMPLTDERWLWIGIYRKDFWFSLVFEVLHRYNLTSWNLSDWINSHRHAQAKSNLGALGWKLTAPEIDALDVAAKKVPKQLIQNSFQNN
jgi:hypothetical protein